MFPRNLQALSISKPINDLITKSSRVCAKTHHSSTTDLIVFMLERKIYYIFFLSTYCYVLRLLWMLLKLSFLIFSIPCFFYLSSSLSLYCAFPICHQQKDYSTCSKNTNCIIHHLKLANEMYFKNFHMQREALTGPFISLLFPVNICDHMQSLDQKIFIAPSIWELLHSKMVDQ